jgi:hypothetical protein
MSGTDMKAAACAPNPAAAPSARQPDKNPAAHSMKTPNVVCISTHDIKGVVAALCDALRFKAWPLGFFPQ